jgi:hypothetical protein
VRPCCCAWFGFFARDTPHPRRAGLRHTHPTFMSVTECARVAWCGSGFLRAIHLIQGGRAYATPTLHLWVSRSATVLLGVVRVFYARFTSPKAGGLTPHPPYIYGCHEVRPCCSVWFGVFARDSTDPRRAGLRHTHPTFMSVTKCDRVAVRGSGFLRAIHLTQGGRAYATPTLHL